MDCKICQGDTRNRPLVPAVCGPNHANPTPPLSTRGRQRVGVSPVPAAAVSRHLLYAETYPTAYFRMPLLFLSNFQHTEQ